MSFLWGCGKAQNSDNDSKEPVLAATTHRTTQPTTGEAETPLTEQDATAVSDEMATSVATDNVAEETSVETSAAVTTYPAEAELDFSDFE